MTSRPKIVVTNRAFPETLSLLSAHGEVDANTSNEPWPADEVRARCADAAAIMAFMTDCLDASFVEACPKLKIIGGALKGADNIDAGAAERHGVWVTNVPDLLTIPTAELAVGLMLAAGRHIVAGDRKIREHGFSGWRPVFYGQGIAGSTVFIIGFGAIGQALARRLAPFDCRIAACDSRAGLEKTVPGVSMVPFEEGLAQADFAVLAIPLSPETVHVIDAGSLKKMKPTAFLINVARGSLVDEAAVAKALDAGLLAGYAADVFECEDWARPGHPASINPRLHGEGAAATVFTPHIGSAVRPVRQEIELHAAKNIVAVLNGENPLSAINNPLRFCNNAQPSSRQDVPDCS